MTDGDLARLQVRISAETSRFDQGMRRTEAVLNRTAQSVEARAATMENRMMRTMSRGMSSSRNFGNAMQQAGFQVGDFFVQVASGQGVMRPLIQQGSQLAGAFGPWGAILGAAGAAVGALGVAFLGTGQEAKSFEDRLKDIQQTMKNLDGLKDQISDLDALREKYGEAAQAVINLMNEERRLERERLGRQLKAERRELINLTGARTGRVAAELGISQPGSTNFFRMQELMEALQQFNLAKTFEDGAVAARRVVEAVEEIRKIEELNPIADELVDRLRKFERTAYDAAATTGELRQDTSATADETKRASDAAANLDRNLGGAASRASTLANELQRGFAAISAMAASAQSQLAVAELQLKFRGDPTGLAKAQAQLETGRAVADQQARAAAMGIPSGIASAMVEPMKQKAQETVDALTKVAEIQGSIAALNKADAAAAKGGGRAAREADKQAEMIAREIQAIQKKLGMLQEEEKLLLARAEAQAAGVPPEEIARQQEILTAAFDRQRIVRELLNKAEQEGIALTPQQRAEVEALSATTERLAVANINLEHSLDAQAKAAEEAKRRQEDLAEAVSDVASRFLGAIEQADSFADALKRVLIVALDLAVQGLGGQGPLGNVLGGVLTGIFGGGGEPLGPIYAKGGAFRGGREITAFARGGIVSGPTIFPMAKGMGLMGEAGPEAIMPLRRGPGGRLGVEAAGGGGTRVVQNFAFDMRGANVSESHMRQVAREAAAQGIASLRRANKHMPQLP